jgi:RNA polymerase sigma-70 factor (ECF subfamily)
MFFQDCWPAAAPRADIKIDPNADGPVLAETIMNPVSEGRFDNLKTLWTLVRRAHGETPDVAAEARGQLLLRYRGAAYRYLLATVRDADTAEELSQEFALKFLRGDFHHAHPGRGRFRDYLRCSLAHLIKSHRRRAARQPEPLGTDLPALGTEAAGEDAAFLTAWREALLVRAWTDLERAEQQTGAPVHTVLRFRVDHPQLSSTELAEQLAARLGKSLSALAVRQALHRAREKFASLLVEAVAQSLDQPTHEQLLAELAELNLLSYCRSLVDR